MSGAVLSIAERLRQAVDKIKEAKRTNDQLQRQTAPGTPMWHHCETVDDHLFNALKLIDGD